MDPMRPCVSTAIASKKSKTSSSLQTPPWLSNQSLSKTNINDLPDVALIEILSRLPHSKILFQCKCVCKRWSSLISDDELRCRFLCLHRRIQNRTLIFKDPKKRREFFMLPELELPMFKSHNFSLRNFLPCFEDPNREPVVLGVCNGLVLCCATIPEQRDYYICNPYTKRYVQVPPTPSCYMYAKVGFICDDPEQVDDDVDFRFAIVRILSEHDDLHEYAFTYRIEIFSSETAGRWKISSVNSPVDFCLFDLDTKGGIVYNGMLCWPTPGHFDHVNDRFIIGLDPYDNPASLHSVKTPYEPPRMYQISPNVSVSCEGTLSRLGVCPRGRRLRLCNLITDYYAPPSLSVWELKDDEQWCNLTAGKICLSPVVREWMRRIPYHQWGFKLENRFDVLALDPSNEDIVYLQVQDRIVTCDIRERKLVETTLRVPFNYMSRYGKSVFPFVIPSWPKPLPKIQIG